MDMRTQPQVVQVKVRSDTRKNFFTDRMGRHWNGVPRELVELPSLEVFEKWHLGT